MEKMVNPQSKQSLFIIAHTSDVSAARIHARQLADMLGFDETQAGQLAIIVTEAVTNILKHAGDGWLFIAPVRRHGKAAIEVVALDRGEGIANIAQSLRDGISTTGTAGTGLGAIKRLSQEFDAFSVPGKGAAFYACVHINKDPSKDEPTPASEMSLDATLQYGAICIPLAGEEECGDAWAVVTDQNSVTMMVADGLGHGADAALASNAAVRTLQQLPTMQPGPLIGAIHDALKITRGAAAAVGRFDLATGNIRFAGVGNINASIIDNDTRKQLVSHNGIVGHNMRKVQEFSQPWPHDAVYIMCSDGIGTQWDIHAYPGLIFCHPTLIAAVIYRDFARGRDDATVLVAKRRG
jgi:anti-sigma regulatory factor (Ser/Thr protein kinase)